LRRVLAFRLDGDALNQRGMIGLSDALTREEIESVRAYVVRQARLAVEAGVVPVQ
jgi:hypothetical protein